MYIKSPFICVMKKAVMLKRYGRKKNAKLYFSTACYVNLAKAKAIIVIVALIMLPSVPLTFLSRKGAH